MYKILLLLAFLGSSQHLSAATVEELSQRLDTLSDEVLKLKQNGQSSQTTFGGYGEFVYINKRSKDQSKNKVANGTNPKVDAQRFILYIGHDFSKKWKLSSEIEIEHANEIFLEQGSLDYHYSQGINAQAGLLLVPVGLINLYHEPTTFLGVNRPEIDSKLLPTTWREMGISFFGESHGLSYRVSLMDGLLASGFSNDGVRSGRQKGSQAEARDLAWVTRLDYKLGGHTVLGASAYLGKAGGVSTDTSHKVYDLHFDSKYAGLYFRGVYTIVKLSNVEQLNIEKSKTGTNSIASQMSGYYANVGYNVLQSSSDSELIPFVQFESYDTQDKIASGYLKDSSKERTNMTYGISYKPLSSIVFKADYVKSTNKAKSGVDSWNLGMGWNF